VKSPKLNTFATQQRTSAETNTNLLSFLQQ